MLRDPVYLGLYIASVVATVLGLATTWEAAILAALLLNAVIVVLFLMVAIADSAARTGLAIRILHGNRWISGFGGMLLAWAGIALIGDVLRASGLT